MRLQVSPNRWSCMPASFAMVLDIPLSELLEEVGHDGSEIIWPGSPEPYRRRAFHWQELQDCAIRRGYAVTLIEPRPRSLPGHDSVSFELPFELPLGLDRLVEHLHRPGVMTGLGSSDVPHAVAWDGEQVYDPAGLVYPIDGGRFTIREFSRFDRIINECCT